METAVRVVGLSGSLRADSLNTMLLRAAMELLPEGMTGEIVPIGELPLYNADVDASRKERPAAVQRFRDALARADALVIASPEYNYSIPGGLKNAIDWASRGEDSPLLNKPVALMGATGGMWGTVRMQQAFRPVFQYLNMQPVNKPEILVAQARQKFNAEGRLTDEATRRLIAQQLQALKELTLWLKSR
jgi:chromate reductase, NAD(P)H dehydrogenase (quinone)